MLKGTGNKPRAQHSHPASVICLYTTLAMTLALTLALTLLAGCNNFFHELIPPAENRIVSFRVANQMGGANIGDTGLTVTVGPGTDLTALLPEISVSPKATLLPLTLAYVAAAFPSVDIAQVAGGIYSANDLSAWVIDLIKANPDFNVPLLTRAMDFTGPVDFLVISGKGTIRRYTAHVSIDTGEAKILGFGFSKYDNPELVSDGLALVNQNNKTIHVIVKYPADYSASFELIPSFELLGDRLEVEGTEVHSGVDSIQFTVGYGTQTKNLTVYRSGYSETNYTLTVMFSEDPDSIRSITDFRFRKSDNPGIAFDAVASIVNSEDLGTIRVQVLYTGSQPLLLVPRYISPGTVTVGGAVQTSGISFHPFTGPLEYKVVSRNGHYSRTYTVQVEWVPVSDLMPRITDFRFSWALNPTLVQDTVGEVNDGAGRILIDAHHGGLFAPDSLVPEFTATGIVRVSGISQSSGISSQDFSRQIKYTVVSPDNPDLQKEYWVQVRFVQDSGASAEITAFSFHPDENPGLTAVGELTARIEPGLGQIFVYLPYGISPAALSIPRFSASGPVSVAGLPQTSGLSPQNFGSPVVYRVDSPNGQNSRTYTVQALSTARIYVDKDATGNGSGTSWANAFTSLKAACDAVASDPLPGLAKEIWIAEGTYRASETGDATAYFPLTPNTSYIGGFAGWESTKTQRNPAANPVVLSGDLGGGVRSRHLFYNPSAVSGVLVFEDLAFTTAQTLTGGMTREYCGAAINVAASSGTVTITNCEFTELVAYYRGGAVYISGAGLNLSGSRFADCIAGNYGGAVNVKLPNAPAAAVNIADVEFTTCSADDGGAVFIEDLYNNANALTLSNISLEGVSSTSMYVKGGISVDGQDNDVTMSDISINKNTAVTANTHSGIRISLTNGGTVELSNLELHNAGIYSSNTNDMTYLNNVAVDNSPAFPNDNIAISGGADISGVIVSGTRNTNAVQISNSSSQDVAISGLDVRSITGRGVYITLGSGAGSLSIDNMFIDGAQASGHGGGLYIESLSTEPTTITELAISNTTAPSIGGGACIMVRGSLNIENNISISSTQSSTGVGGLYIHNGSTQPTVISGLAISDTVAASNAGGAQIVVDGSLSITNTSINGTRANTGSGGGLYILNRSSQNTTIAGLNISDAKAIGSSSYGNGGGASIEVGGGLLIDDVDISDTEGIGAGGGLYILNSSSQNTTITGLNISRAKATNPYSSGNGGGAYIRVAGGLSIGGGEIVDTEATCYGGGLYIGNSSSQPVTITGLTVRNATAALSGGGLHANTSGPITISGDSEFKNCRSAGSIGGLYLNTSTVTIQDTRFIDNYAAYVGYEIVYIEADSAAFTNCEFKDTGPHFYGPTGATDQLKALVRIDGKTGPGSTASFTDCTFENLKTNQNGSGFVVSSYNIGLAITDSTFIMDTTQRLGAIYANGGFDLNGVSFSEKSPVQTSFMEIMNPHVYRIRQNCSYDGISPMSLASWYALPIYTSGGATLIDY
jgi:hypothetical protein